MNVELAPDMETIDYLLHVVNQIIIQNSPELFMHLCCSILANCTAFKKLV